MTEYDMVIDGCKSDAAGKYAMYHVVGMQYHG